MRQATVVRGQRHDRLHREAGLHPDRQRPKIFRVDLAGHLPQCGHRQIGSRAGTDLGEVLRRGIADITVPGTTTALGLLVGRLPGGI